MAGQRVVAGLGRPETPDETAARKAESSRIYRSSQTFRNLIAALLATVAVVAVVYFAVPRGTGPEPEPVDVAASAAAAQATLGRTVIVPDAPADWRANSARMEDGAWRVVYAPAEDFVRIAQGFDQGDAWVSRIIGGYAATGTETIAGITWDVYEVPRDAALSYALATTAGPDTILIYGPMSPEIAAQAAAAVADDVQALREEDS